jgi:phosphoglucosamine mutase
MKKIFGETDGIRATVGEFPLRPNATKMLGTAIAEEMSAKKILMARDTRESGIWINESIASGLKERDVEVEDLGVLPTPAVQKLLTNGGFDGGIMITASHNPATDNGIKVFRADGDKLDDTIELAIEDRFFAHELEADIEPVECNFVEMGVDADSVEKYADMASEALGMPKNEGVGSFLVDSASGAGYVFSHALFEDFGFEVENIDPTPNGKNINDGYGALHPENLSKLCKQRGEMGIALDGDADRAILVDELGRIWTGDRIIAMMALYLKERGELTNNLVVLTEYSNLAAIRFLEAADVRVEKVVNGDREVMRKLQELGGVLGGENAGHIIYLPWLNSSDGSFVALFARRVMAEKGCRLADLWPDYEEFPNAQIAVKVREKRDFKDIPGWSEAVEQGLAALEGRGRVFVRYSGTEMKLRILVEGPDLRENTEIAEGLSEIIKKEIGND